MGTETSLEAVGQRARAATRDTIERIFAAAKASDRILTDDELAALAGGKS